MVIESPSYLDMKLHLDGYSSMGLRVPTFWDATEQQWIAAIQTPDTKTMVQATGKDSFELQNNFNKKLKEVLKEDKLGEEVFAMFKPEDQNE